MTDHLGRGLGMVLIALSTLLGACPSARAQRDVDRELKEVFQGWIEGSPASRERAFQRLASLSSNARPAVPLLIGALHDPSPLLRGRAAALIGQIGASAKESVPALMVLLKDPEAAVRDEAAKALAQFGRRAERSIDALVDSLHAPPDRRCPGATLALASIGEPAVPALIALLKADDPALRRAVIEGIQNAMEQGSWHHGSAASNAIGPHYQGLVKDADPGVRIALASMLVLTRSASPVVLSALGGLLRDPDVEVRLAVAKAVEAYSQLPTGLRVSFLELLKDDDCRVRVAAARAIPHEALAALVVIDRLLGALEDPDDEVRAAAVTKLAEARNSNAGTEEQNRPVLFVWTSAALAHHPTAGRDLLSALDDSSSRVRAAAAGLLAAFPRQAERSIPLLTERLKDPARSVRAAAAESLQQLGPATHAVVRGLLAILANPDGGTNEGRLASFNAARALTTIGGEARAKMLRLLIGQLNSLDDRIRERAEQIIVALGPKIGGDLLRILADPKSPRRVQVEAQGLLYTLLLQNQAQHLFTASPPRPESLAAVPVSRTLAMDAEPELRLASAALLAAIDPGAAEAADLYLDYLRSGMDPDLKDQWIGQVIRPPMIPTLIKGLGDQDNSVRVATANVLSTLAQRLSAGEAQDEAEAGKTESTRARARENGRRLKTQAARALLSSLKDRDVRVRWIAAETLGVLHVEPKAVIPALIGMVKTEGGRVPTDDIALHSFQDDYLLGQNNKGGDPLRVAAIQALGGFGREAAGAVPQLVHALRDEDLRVRWFAAEALGLIGPAAKAAVPALVEALRSRDVAPGDATEGSGVMVDGPIRLIAAFALGKIGPEARAAIPDLIAALSGPDSRVRGEAARALGLIGPEARAAVPDLIRLATRGTVDEVAERAVEALAVSGPTIPSASAVDEVAERAAEALGQLSSLAVPALIESLHDDDPEIRVKALAILGRMNAKAAVPVTALVRCLSDRDADVREAAANALASARDRHGVVAAIPALIIALGDKEGRVSDAARNTLTGVAKPALPAILAILPAASAHALEPSDGFESVVIPLEP